MKNAFVVFVVALFAFGNEVRSEDVDGLKLNQITVALLTSEPSHAGNVREIANSVTHTDGLRARPIVGHDSFQSTNGMLFLRSIDLALLSSETGELVFGGPGTSCRRIATTGNSSLAALLGGCVDAAVFTVAGLQTLLNSGWANGGPFSQFTWQDRSETAYPLRGQNSSNV